MTDSPYETLTLAHVRVVPAGLCANRFMAGGFGRWRQKSLKALIRQVCDWTGPHVVLHTSSHLSPFTSCGLFEQDPGQLLADSPTVLPRAQVSHFNSVKACQATDTAFPPQPAGAAQQ